MRHSTRRHHTDFQALACRVALIVMILTATLIAQEVAGTFEIDGTTHTVEKAQLDRQLRRVKIEQTGHPAHHQLVRAWARIIQETEAERAGVVLDDKVFAASMSDYHRLQRQRWMRGGRADKDLFDAYLKNLGFDDIHSYEAACRRRFAAGKYLEQKLGVPPVTESAVRELWRLMKTRLEIEVVCFAPETVKEAPPARDTKQFKDEFGAWWSALPESARRSHDSTRPALEIEALYFRFRGHTMDSLESYFEAKRPELGGRSFQEVTADIQPDDRVIRRLKTRWRRWRRSLMASLNAQLEAGLDDDAAFEKVREHLLRQWRLTMYLDDVWTKLNDGPRPIDLKAAARKYGVPYIGRKLQTMWKLVNDTLLPGDHPGMLRKTAPGELMVYGTNPKHAESLFFSEGLADQPGGHVSLWRLVRKEEQRVLTVEQALKEERACREFETEWKWKKACKIVEIASTRQQDRMLALADENDGENADAEKFRAAAWAEIEVGLKDARTIGPFFVSPHAPETRPDQRTGPVEQRVISFLQSRWEQAFGRPKSSYIAGQVMRPTGHPPSRVAAVTRILNVHAPDASRFKRDRIGRATARRILESERLRTLDRALRQIYEWPAVVRKYTIKSKELDDTMKKALGL